MSVKWANKVRNILIEDSLYPWYDSYNEIENTFKVSFPTLNLNKNPKISAQILFSKQ